MTDNSDNNASTNGGDRSIPRITKRALIVFTNRPTASGGSILNGPHVISLLQAAIGDIAIVHPRIEDLDALPVVEMQRLLTRTSVLISPHGDHP